MRVGVLEQPMRKGLLALLILAAVLYLLLPLYQRNRVPLSPIIPYSTFVAEARQGRVARVVIRGDSIVEGTFKSGKAFRTYVVPGDTSFVQVLLAHGAAVTVEPRSQPFWTTLLPTLLSLLVLVVLWLLVGRQRRIGPRS